MRWVPTEVVRGTVAVAERKVVRALLAEVVSGLLRAHAALKGVGGDGTADVVFVVGPRQPTIDCRERADAVIVLGVRLLVDAGLRTSSSAGPRMVVAFLTIAATTRDPLLLPVRTPASTRSRTPSTMPASARSRPQSAAWTRPTTKPTSAVPSPPRRHVCPWARAAGTYGRP